MNVEIVNRDFRSVWNKFIMENNHHFFHYFEWGDIFHKAYGFKPMYLAVWSEKKELVAVLPLFYTESLLFGSSLKSFPYHIEGGLVFNSDLTDKGQVYELILKKLLELQSELRVRNVDIKFSDKTFIDFIPDDLLRIYKRYFRYVVDIDESEELLLKSFRQDIRNSTRRAKKFDVRVEVTDTPDDINAFYKLYVYWSRGIGLPGHSETFFRLIWDTFYPKGMTKIVFAHIKDELVAAKLFLIDPSNGHVLQNWGTIKDFRLNKYQVNTALHWGEIKWSVAHKYKTFDFGVTSEFNKGVQYFKKGWNTKEKMIYFCNIGDFSKTKKRDDHNAGQLFRVFWNKAPLTVVKHVGPFILKQGN